MEIVPLEIGDVKLVKAKRFNDARGFFSEVYKQSAFAEAGLPIEFVQDNHSRSTRAGTVRGLHFQLPPFAQAKLVRVTRGRILDVAVDVRRTSPTFGRHVAVELSEENWLQLLVPVGFAHGFCTLEPDTEVLYKVSAVYAPQCDAGILWNDPDLGITWPVDARSALVSDKDRGLPRLKDARVLF
ncbi:MAG TPA: dTDP-4-dehydrorhamnose 3,5-epimerase [Hyphomicrobiaceae bacterium]|nr:dTDP-4-dehydrorhamnose 3,5-epimerase [Hyphomicrobiaceae bacterium]